MSAMLLLLVMLILVTSVSLMLRPENITPVAVFAALWIAGLLAALGRPTTPLDWGSFGVVATASVYLFVGERLVRADAGEPAAPPGSSRSAARFYWILTLVAVAGAALKLRAAFEFAGGDVAMMLAPNVLRGAVTSASLVFSPVVTALTSSMYVAAALTGYLCRDRIRPRYFAHLIAVLLDSVAISGRGSFLIVGMITLLGLGVAWRGPKRRGVAVLGIATGSLIAFVVGLSLIIGRSDVVDTLWEYVVAPLYGLSAYLKGEPPTGVHGPTLVNALTAKLGGDLYDAGDFVWTTPFVANVSSGFRELLSDTGRVGLGLFIPLGAATMAAHRSFRLQGGWAPYAVAVSLYAYLGYFYYVSLGAFLPGWWLLLLSGVAAAVFATATRRPARTWRIGR